VPRTPAGIVSGSRTATRRETACCFMDSDMSMRDHRVLIAAPEPHRGRIGTTPTTGHHPPPTDRFQVARPGSTERSPA
jgi:hypothetical protein